MTHKSAAASSYAEEPAFRSLGAKAAPEAVTPAIVCVSDLFWDEHWSSEQQLMVRLSERTKILYVERPVSPLSFFTRSSDASLTQQIRRALQGGVRFVNPNLAIMMPPPVLPLRYMRWFNAINEAIRLRAIRRAVRTLALKDFVLWLYPPEAGRLVGKLGELLSVYYCTDDWGAVDQWWNRAADIRAREGELADKCDLVVGTSTRIVERWRATKKDVLLVTNGADVSAFAQAKDPELKIPSEIARIPEPRIGFVGFLDGRFDTALYAKLAALRPAWNFVIVGPFQGGNAKLAHLQKLPNVHLLGGRDRADLPRYLKGFQVCTIPYVRSTLSESIFPLKLFEYLAAGRPVVATHLPELKPYGEFVRFGDNAETFASAIESCLEHPPVPASADFLNQNSWDAKADLLWARLQGELRQRAASPMGEAADD